jgi:thioredoxin-related protein
MTQLKQLGAIVAIILFMSSLAHAQDKAKINWMTIEEAFNANKKEPRKILIDVYTDWCGWCKVMDKNTFSHDVVAGYVNKKYYAVKLNAERAGDVTLGDKKYDNRQLAALLLQNRMSYPTVVYLNEKFDMIQPIPGYQDAKAFHQVITFLGDDFYKKEEFEKFKAGTYTKKFAKNMEGVKL